MASPEGYNLSRPAVIKLPIELDEISGLSYYSKDTSLFAIHDERGWLYKIHINNTGIIDRWHYYNNDDYEDIVLLDSTFYVLQASGNIVAYRFTSGDSVILKVNEFAYGNGNEFESLYYDPFSQTLKMICKDCEDDKKKILSVYEFDPHTYLFKDQPYQIDVKRIAALLNEKSIKLKPSAAAIHPITSDLYIISAVNKLLIIADKNGNAKNAYKLDRAIFKQPEGLTFNDAGDMFISNEAADIGVANVLFYKYKLQKTK
jgi:uncharacterized protein YjiK